MRGGVDYSTDDLVGRFGLVRRFGSEGRGGGRGWRLEAYPMMERNKLRAKCEETKCFKNYELRLIFEVFRIFDLKLLFFRAYKNL